MPYFRWRDGGMAVDRAHFSGIRPTRTNYAWTRWKRPLALRCSGAHELC